MSISVSVSLSKLPFPHSITLIHFTSDYSEVFHVLCVKSQQTLIKLTKHQGCHMTYIAYHSNTQRNTHSHCSEGGGSCGSGRLVRLDFISLPHSHTNSTVQFEDISTPMQDIPTALQEQPVQSNLQVCMKEIKLTNQLNLVTGKKSLPGHSCTVLTQVQSNFCPFPMQISWVQQLWEINVHFLK